MTGPMTRSQARRAVEAVVSPNQSGLVLPTNRLLTLSQSVRSASAVVSHPIQAPSRSTSRVPAMSTSKSSKALALSTSSAPAVSTSRAPAVSTSRAPAVSTSRAPAVSTSRAPAGSTARDTAVTTSRVPAVSTSRTAAVSTSRAIAVSTARVTSRLNSKSTSVPVAPTLSAPLVSTSTKPEINILDPPTCADSTVLPKPSVASARTLPASGRRTTLHEKSEQIKLILAFEKSQCGFCSMELKEREGIMLDYCLHIFCRECLVSAIELQEGAQINCPISEESGCYGYLLDKEIKALAPPELYQKYMERSMLLARKDMENVFQCLTPGCDVWCEFEPGTKTFPCYVCNKTNCLDCQAIHEGLACSVYQKILKLAKSSGQETKDLMEKEKKEAEANAGGWDQLMDLIKVKGSQLGYINMESVLKELQEIHLFKTTREFDCPICMTEVPIGQGIILQDCLHMFCSDCLIGLIQHTDDPQVKCPHMEAKHSCINNLKPREIKALVPADIYEGYLLRSEKLAENGMANSYHCKTPDCLGWWEMDPVGGDQFEQFNCPVCGKNNCLMCKVIHEGISCADYKNRLVQNDNDQLSENAVNDMVTKGECMRCPKCKIAVEKTIGCDWLMCTACRTELCWATKQTRWGPLGKGDVTGGCKCQYLTHGPKCAPNCMNCH